MAAILWRNGVWIIVTIIISIIIAVLVIIFIELTSHLMRVVFYRVGQQFGHMVDPENFTTLVGLGGTRP